MNSGNVRKADFIPFESVAMKQKPMGLLSLGELKSSAWGYLHESMKYSVSPPSPVVENALVDGPYLFRREGVAAVHLLLDFQQLFYIAGIGQNNRPLAFHELVCLPQRCLFSHHEVYDHYGCRSRLSHRTMH